MAELFRQSERTIRRLVEKIERRGLLTIERVRGDHGHYTHCVYDFTPLRARLNECYYEDHPQERPASSPRPARPAPAAPAAPGFVYLLRSPQGCKIGRTRNPARRLEQISPKVPFPVTLEHTVPCDPSLHFKRKADVWSVRVGRHYRALAFEAEDGYDWFWIGPQAEYDHLLPHL